MTYQFLDWLLCGKPESKVVATNEDLLLFDFFLAVHRQVSLSLSVFSLSLSLSLS